MPTKKGVFFIAFLKLTDATNTITISARPIGNTISITTFFCCVTGSIHCSFRITDRILKCVIQCHSNYPKELQQTAFSHTNSCKITIITKLCKSNFLEFLFQSKIRDYGFICKQYLSSELGARQAQREVVKIKHFDFSYWA